MLAAGPIDLREPPGGSGVDFRFHAGSRGRRDLPEIMGGGLAAFDADGDGRLDLYLCNGGPIVVGPDPPCRVYLGRGDGTFEDATDRAGAPGPPYAMGAAVGDVDGDGRPDLFVTGWRGQRLYRNLGGGAFEDVTGPAGLDSESDRWGTSAAFADLDGDGDPDLYVCHYVAYDPARAPYCAAPDGRRDFCGPEMFSAQPDRLYRNDGGRFVEVGEAAGIARPGGRGLGVLVADLVGDHRPDIFVANDGSACWLFENKGGFAFEEVGLAAGVALDGAGDALAAMGVALGDLDGDGRAELVAANFLGRGTVAFAPAGPDRYADASAALGLKAATRGVLGFGLGLADLDGDGHLDLLQANGHVLDRARLGEPFAMRPTLLRGGGEGVRLSPTPAGPWADRPALGRGLALADLDGDARPDAVLAALDARPTVLLNRSEGGNFVALDLGPAAGARVRAEAGGRVLARQVVGGGSYLSAAPPTVFLGLGDGARLDRVEVSWPSGRVEAWLDLPAGVTHRLTEGGGSGPSTPQ